MCHIGNRLTFKDALAIIDQVLEPSLIRSDFIGRADAGFSVPPGKHVLVKIHNLRF